GRFDGSDLERAGVVDEDVEATEAPHRGRDRIANLYGIADIASHCEGLAAALGDRTRSGVDLASAARREDDARSGGCQLDRGRPADAPTGAGHERDAAAQVRSGDSRSWR